MDIGAFKEAREELGDFEYFQHLDIVFGTKCLNYVKTLVINLPDSCLCDCKYCIDKELRKSKRANDMVYLIKVKRLLEEFSQATHITITGGNATTYLFNQIMNLIQKYKQNAIVTWNTNGIGNQAIYKEYNISPITHINLHRHSKNNYVNWIKFNTKYQIIDLYHAKEIFGPKLSIRTVIDEHFDLDNFVDIGLPLFLNRLLPGTEESEQKFSETIEKLTINKTERKRNNQYYDTYYRNIPIRIGVGDKVYKHIPGRKPVFLNVAILHRSGIVSGTWYEDDKVIWGV